MVGEGGAEGEQRVTGEETTRKEAFHRMSSSRDSYLQSELVSLFLRAGLSNFSDFVVARRGSVVFVPVFRARFARGVSSAPRA